MKRRLLAIFTLMVMLISLIPAEAFAVNLDGGQLLPPINNGQLIPDTTTGCPPHDWGDWIIIKEATCTEPGVRQRVCKRCGSYSDREEYGPLGHKWKFLEVVSEGNCVTPGENREKCSRCGKTRRVKGDYGDHLFGEWYEPEGRIGVRERDCSYCGLQEFEYFPVLSIDITETSTPAMGDAYRYDEIVEFNAHIVNKGEGTATNPFIIYGSQLYSCADLAWGDEDTATGLQHWVTSDEVAQKEAKIQANGGSDEFAPRLFQHSHGSLHGRRALVHRDEVSVRLARLRPVLYRGRIHLLSGHRHEQYRRRPARLLHNGQRGGRRRHVYRRD